MARVSDEAAERVVTLGLSCLFSSSRPVVGEVLWALSHCSMALRSYVKPSAYIAFDGVGAR